MISQTLQFMDQRISRLFALLWPVPRHAIDIGFAQMSALIFLGNLPSKLVGILHPKSSYQRLKLHRSFIHDPWGHQRTHGMAILWRASIDNEMTDIVVKTADEAIMIAGLVNRIVAPCLVASSPVWRSYSTPLWTHISRMNGINFEDNIRGDLPSTISKFRFRLMLSADYISQSKNSNNAIEARAVFSMSEEDQYWFSKT